MASNKATVIFLSVILILGIVALIMAIIAWADFEIVVKAETEARGTNDGGEAGGETKTPEEKKKQEPVYYHEPGMPPMGGKEKVYTFAYEDYGTQNYIKNGRLGGPSVEIVTAVCEAMRKQCVHIFAGVDPVGCWDDGVGGGTDILAGKYDGCPNWYGTIERGLVHDFTANIYRKPLPTKFYRKVGSNVTSLEGVKVAFTSSSRQSVICARAGGVNVTSFTVVNKDSTADAMKAVEDGDVEAAFLRSSSSSVTGNSALEPVPAGPEAVCSRTGGAVMVRKGSPVLGWFNDGLQQIQDNGRFSAICEAAQLSQANSCVVA